MGRKKAELVKLGTWVLLYELGGREPAVLPGARLLVAPVFAVAAVEGLEGGRPGSPTGPDEPISAPPAASFSGRSDMALDMTLIAGPPDRSGGARPEGKDDLSSP